MAESPHMPKCEFTDKQGNKIKRIQHAHVGKKRQCEYGCCVNWTCSDCGQTVGVNNGHIQFGPLDKGWTPIARPS